MLRPWLLVKHRLVLIDQRGVIAEKTLRLAAPHSEAGSASD